jgi:hypothetical protein
MELCNIPITQSQTPKCSWMSIYDKSKLREQIFLDKNEIIFSHVSIDGWTTDNLQLE